MRTPVASHSVLLVDDDAAMVSSLADILRVHGYTSARAGTARDALLRAEEALPILAVVDLRLPDMDGLELVGRLHALHETIEIAVLTGHASMESAVAAIRERSIDYLVKPVQIEQFLSVVSVAAERWARKQAERELHASDKRYRTLFESNPQPLWVLDRDSLRFLAVNEAAVSHYGYSREQFLNMTLTDIGVREERECVRQAVGKQEPFVDATWRHQKADGTVMDVAIRSHGITWDGRAARVLLASDITARVAAERAMLERASQQGVVARLGQRALAAELPQLLIEAVDLVKETLAVPLVRILDAGSDGESMAVTAVSAADSAAVPGIESASPTEEERHTFRHREPTVVSASTTAPGLANPTQPRAARSSITVLIPGQAKPYGVLAAHDPGSRDFTIDDAHFLQAIANVLGSAIERARAEEAARRSQRMEAIGQLAGGVAHDFNNMLTAITGYGEILCSQLPAGSPECEDVQEILKVTQRAAALTQQLLAFSRQQVMQPCRVDLSLVVSEMENMMRRLLGSRIEFVTQLERNLEPVMADPTQIQQVIMNLCVNARDAMENGGTLIIRTVNVAPRRDTSRSSVLSGACVALEVSDTGSGMDTETIARIFEPFFTTKPEEQGTGLGLATVYGIVTQSGGDITVTSEVGTGTTFSIYLPADRSPAIASTPAVSLSVNHHP